MSRKAGNVDVDTRLDAVVPWRSASRLADLLRDPGVGVGVERTSTVPAALETIVPSLPPPPPPVRKFRKLPTPLPPIPSKTCPLACGMTLPKGDVHRSVEDCCAYLRSLIKAE